MNILLLTTHLNTGGITSYLLTLSKGLIREGHRVHLASSGGNQFEDFAYAGVEHLMVDIKTKSELDFRLYGAVGQIRRYILEKNIHVIHSHTRVTQVMGWLLQKFTGKPYLSTCHGFFKTRMGRRMFPCWGKAVIAISEQVKEHLQKDFEVKAEQIFVVPNGIDINKFSSYQEEYRKEKKRHFSLEGYELVGIIARLSDVKGHSVLIKAMTKVVKSRPDARLVIVGEGKERENLQRLVEQLGFANYVYFFPVVNKTGEFLDVFDVFAMPSLQEGLGLAVMEAQAASLPVVASSVGGLPTLIEHGRTGLLVPPQDIDALADAIIELLTNRSKAIAMGKAAREFVEQNFSADGMVKKTLAVYEKLQGKK